MAYTGWELPEEERARLLSLFPTVHADVLAHHITHKFGVPADTVPPEGEHAVVMGVAQSDSVQALVVMVNLTMMRPDGNFYHCTWSVDREKGGKPMHSNTLLKESGFTHVDPVYFRVVPRTFT